MNRSDVAAFLGLATLFTGGGSGRSKEETQKYYLRNKTAHGRARKAKNKAARASRKLNRQRD